MLVFVDFLGLDGEYTPAAAPSWIHPSMPIEVITGPVFLDAQLGSGAATIRGLYHLEHGHRIEAKRLLETRVAPMDTLIVVNTDAESLGHSAQLDRFWQRHGGATRRLRHSGMPAAERTALARYAQ